MTALSSRVGRSNSFQARLYAQASGAAAVIAARVRFPWKLREAPRYSLWLTGLVGIVVLKAVVSLNQKPDSCFTAYSGILYFFLLLFAAGFALRNAIQNTLKGRPFWVFLAIAYGFWAFNQWLFLYYNLGLQMEVPDNSIADPVLFLHVALLISAVATLPHKNLDGRKLYPALLNALLLFILWSFLYFYAVFPYQLFSNAPGYALGFDVLYPLENWALVLSVGFLSVRASAPWKSVYLHLLGASTLYALSSAVANFATDSGGYVNGKLYGVGLTASVCWFAWIQLRARQLADREVRANDPDSRRSSKASAWAMVVVVLISVPIVWELLRNDHAIGMGTFRVLVAVSAIMCLASAAFIKEYLTKSELALHLSSVNDRLHLAMGSGRAVGWEWDAKTSRISWFGDLKTNFGIDSETYVERAADFFYRYVHPEDREQVSEAVTAARRNHKSYEGEFRVVWPDGTLRWVTAKGEFQYSSKGEPERMLGIATDITERKELRRALLENQDRIVAIVENSDDAIISKNLDGIILSWNRAAQRLFEYPEEEVIGQPITIIIPEDRREEEATIMQRLRAGERVDHFETIRIAKSGKELRVSLTISPMRDSSGRIVAASKIARDISERRRTEQVLRESEDRFRLVANTAPVLIWMSGVDKLCTFFNQGWLNFTGRSMQQELGDGWVSGVHPDDLDHCLAVYAAAFDARVDFQMEYRLRRFDGEYRWLVDFGVPRFESDGTFCGFIGSCVDITERKTSEESLHTLTGRLIAAQEEERARIARELHDDFSQRLALLGIGLGQLWKRLPKSDLQERAIIQEMLEGTKEMSSDLHSLSHQLHSSKLEHVGLVPALNALCKEIAQKYNLAVQFKNSGLALNLPKDVALCLFRVAQEALGNVVKHSRTLQAQVELYVGAAQVTLCISDQGRGFDPRIQNSAAGIGMIGMTERLRIVGGKLLIKSEPNRGTEILAEVPLAVSSDETQFRTQAAGR